MILCWWRAYITSFLLTGGLQSLNVCKNVLCACNHWCVRTCTLHLLWCGQCPILKIIDNNVWMLFHQMFHFLFPIQLKLTVELFSKAVSSHQQWSKTCRDSPVKIKCGRQRIIGKERPMTPYWLLSFLLFLLQTEKRILPPHSEPSTTASVSRYSRFFNNSHIFEDSLGSMKSHHMIPFSSPFFLDIIIFLVRSLHGFEHLLFTQWVSDMPMSFFISGDGQLRYFSHLKEVDEHTARFATSSSQSMTGDQSKYEVYSLQTANVQF